MNNYITLDGLRYKTPWKAWGPPTIVNPGTVRLMLNGSLDATYGQGTVYTWTGEIIGPAIPEAGEYGDIDDLLASLREKNGLSFTDHLGNAFTVYVRGEIKQRSMSPVWNSEENEIYVNVTLMGVSA